MCIEKKEIDAAEVIKSTIEWHGHVQELTLADDATTAQLSKLTCAHAARLVVGRRYGGRWPPSGKRGRKAPREKEARVVL